MNTFTLNFSDISLPIFRLFDGLLTPSSDTPAGKIAQGQQDIADGNTEKGEGEILEGTGKLLEEQAEKTESEESNDEPSGMDRAI